MSRITDKMVFESDVQLRGKVYGKAATAITPGATATVYTTLNKLFTYTSTDNQDCTLSANEGGQSGQEINILFITAGTADEVITFSTNFHSVGTLTLGTTADRYYMVTFISNGTAWFEKCRTAVQT